MVSGEDHSERGKSSGVKWRSRDQTVSSSVMNNRPVCPRHQSAVIFSTLSNRRCWVVSRVHSNHAVFLSCVSCFVLNECCSGPRLTTLILLSCSDAPPLMCSMCAVNRHRLPLCRVTLFHIFPFMFPSVVSHRLTIVSFFHSYWTLDSLKSPLPFMNLPLVLAFSVKVRAVSVASAYNIELDPPSPRGRDLVPGAVKRKTPSSSTGPVSFLFSNISKALHGNMGCKMLNALTKMLMFRCACSCTFPEEEFTRNSQLIVSFLYSLQSLQFTDWTDCVSMLKRKNQFAALWLA